MIPAMDVSGLVRHWHQRTQSDWRNSGVNALESVAQRQLIAASACAVSTVETHAVQRLPEAETAVGSGIHHRTKYSCDRVR